MHGTPSSELFISFSHLIQKTWWLKPALCVWKRTWNYLGENSKRFTKQSKKDLGMYIRPSGCVYFAFLENYLLLRVRGWFWFNLLTPDWELNWPLVNGCCNWPPIQYLTPGMKGTGSFYSLFNRLVFCTLDSAVLLSYSVSSQNCIHNIHVCLCVPHHINCVPK